MLSGFGGDLVRYSCSGSATTPALRLCLAAQFLNLAAYLLKATRQVRAQLLGGPGRVF